MFSQNCVLNLLEICRPEIVKSTEVILWGELSLVNTNIANTTSHNINKVETIFCKFLLCRNDNFIITLILLSHICVLGYFTRINDEIIYVLGLGSVNESPMKLFPMKRGGSSVTLFSPDKTKSSIQLIYLIKAPWSVYYWMYAACESKPVM